MHSFAPASIKAIGTKRSLYMETRRVADVANRVIPLLHAKLAAAKRSHSALHAAAPTASSRFQAGYDSGELITKPIMFSGNRMLLNYSTSAVGSLRVELQDKQGQPFPDFALDDCPEIYGDRVDNAVSWKASTDVSSLAGKTVRIRIVLRDADLFALRFGE